MKNQDVNIHVKKEQFYIEDVELKVLADTYQTPLYIYSKSVMNKKISDMQWFMTTYPNTKVAYAAKAFACKGIFKMFSKVGLGIDVVSMGELYTAIKAGVDPAKIEFNGNNKTDEELAFALESKVGLIIVDNAYEIVSLEKIASEKTRVQNVLLRINPIVDAKTHKHIATATKESKFGVIIDSATDAIKQIIKCTHLNFKGLHIHIGSQLMDNEDHIKALHIVLGYIKQINDLHGIVVEELNIGGGFGVYYKEGDAQYDFKSFISPVMSIITDFCATHGIKCPTIVIEPGRYLVANAGMTLYRAGTMKPLDDNKTILAVDGGMTDNLRPMLYSATYEADALNHQSKRAHYSIVGKCCESSDVIIGDIVLNQVHKNDLIAVYNTGAYGYSMSNNYNRNLIPAVVMIDKNQVIELVKRQSLEQMLQNDI